MVTVAVTKSVWNPTRKTPADGEAVKVVYEEIANCIDAQRKNYKELYLPTIDAATRASWEKQLGELGFWINWEKGHVCYKKDFKPVELDYDVCYIRHGKTEGNTEPRIYQGFCDYWENQLTEVGKKQAIDAAKKTEEVYKSGTFVPDLILCSPLGRAIETGEPFFTQHPEIPTRVAYEAREQQFGSWDNAQVRHLPKDDICHLFYLEQNGLVKPSEPHVGPDGTTYPGENFVELIIREAAFLKSVNDEAEIKKAKSEGRKGKVLIYGHSMAGAACSALLGQGKVWTEDNAVGFDGKYILPNATPYMLPAQLPKLN